MPGTTPGGTIRLICQHCGAGVDKTLGWLKRHNLVPCPGCGKPIRVRRFRAQAGAEAQFKELTGFAGEDKGR